MWESMRKSGGSFAKTGDMKPLPLENMPLIRYHLQGRLSPLEENYDTIFRSTHPYKVHINLNHLTHCCVHTANFETGRPVLNQVNGHNRFVTNNYSYMVR